MQKELFPGNPCTENVHFPTRQILRNRFENPGRWEIDETQPWILLKIFLYLNNKSSNTHSRDLNWKSIRHLFHANRMKNFRFSVQPAVYPITKLAFAKISIFKLEIDRRDTQAYTSWRARSFEFRLPFLSVQVSQ